MMQSMNRYFTHTKTFLAKYWPNMIMLTAFLVVYREDMVKGVFLFIAMCWIDKKMEKRSLKSVASAPPRNPLGTNMEHPFDWDSLIPRLFPSADDDASAAFFLAFETGGSVFVHEFVAAAMREGGEIVAKPG